jgi:hypothetical protein
MSTVTANNINLFKNGPESLSDAFVCTEGHDRQTTAYLSLKLIGSDLRRSSDLYRRVPSLSRKIQVFCYVTPCHWVNGFSTFRSTFKITHWTHRGPSKRQELLAQRQNVTGRKICVLSEIAERTVVVPASCCLLHCSRTWNIQHLPIIAKQILRSTAVCLRQYL